MLQQTQRKKSNILRRTPVRQTEDFARLHADKKQRNLNTRSVEKVFTVRFPPEDWARSSVRLSAVSDGACTHISSPFSCSPSRMGESASAATMGGVSRSEKNILST